MDLRNKSGGDGKFEWALDYFVASAAFDAA